MADRPVSRMTDTTTGDAPSWISLTSGQAEPYRGLAAAVRHEHGEAALDEEEALALFHAQLTIMTRYSFNTRQLEPWDVYERLLEPYADRAQREDLRVLWDFANREVRRHGELEPARYLAEVPTAMYEIDAETTVEFIELLRMLIVRSGVTKHQVARRAPSTGPGKLNPSQLYSLLDRGTLPRSAAQMRSLGEACGLDEHQTQQLLRVWATLRNAQSSSKRVRATSHAGADRGLAVRHRPRHQPVEGATRTGDRSFDRADVQKWVDRADRARRARSGWAPPEPTSTQAVREAATMAGYLRRTFGAEA